MRLLSYKYLTSVRLLGTEAESYVYTYAVFLGDRQCSSLADEPRAEVPRDPRVSIGYLEVADDTRQV